MLPVTPLDMVMLPVALLATWIGVAVYIRVLHRRGNLLTPGARSMHTVPLPGGAGIVPVSVLLASWFLSLGSSTGVQTWLIVTAAGLALLSWVDDMIGLPAAPRLLAHAAAVGGTLLLISPELQAMPWLPLPVERLLEACAWIWFINLFNFMDGIDGLAGSEAIAITLGYVAIIYLVGLQGMSGGLAALIAVSMLGYLFWNWPPARVLMGDAGSIPLGFLLGWLMLELALRGYWASAMILPLFFCADATFTLIRRLSRGASPNQPHRDHYYQRAALGCGSHRTVVVAVTAANSLLIVASILALSSASWGICLAVAIVTTLICRLAQMSRK
jgi:UDP-N-acetylmuramyl pentapeptide phosphotransferase/UDP-N-acetylglucosamine-1-phosphate transferase